MPGRKTIPLFDLLSRTDPATSGLPRVGADRNGPRAQHGVATPLNKTPVPPRGTVPQRDTKPVVRVELKPQAMAQAGAEPSTQAADSHVESSAPSAPAQTPSAAPRPQVQSAHARGGLLAAASAGRTITLPALLPVLSVAIVLAAVITTWIIAYGRGAKDKEANLSLQLPPSNRPTITEPGSTLQPDLRNQIPSNNPTSTPSASPSAGQANQSSPAKPTTPASNPSTTSTSGLGLNAANIAPLATLQAQPPAAAAIMTSTGWKTTEIRQVGLNYLNIATLKHADAASAVHFLAQNGVEAFGVPLAAGSGSGLASGRGRANTSSPVTYRVFVLPGISSEQYRARQSVMTNLEASVARLGRQWSRDQRGVSDFRSPQWTKFDDK